MLDATFAPPMSFFHTLPVPCPYIDGLMERRLIADLDSRRGRLNHDALARAGFRRTQTLIYRPACPTCNACKPVRTQIARFKPNRAFARCIAANLDLVPAWRPTQATEEQYELFNRYQSGRHTGGEMGLMDFADYADMVERTPIDSALIEYRDADQRLMAVILVDRQDDGFSAVYSFFDPDLPRRGLGTFMVLDLIAQAAAAGLPYLYLGYWIAGSRKMSYKTRFQPCEFLVDGKWIPAKDLPD